MLRDLVTDGKLFGHLAPGLAWGAVALVLFEAPGRDRKNLLKCVTQHPMRMSLVMTLLGIGMVQAATAGDTPLHTVHHEAGVLGPALAFLSSWAESHGYVCAGGSNLILASAYLAEAAVFSGHPAGVAETRGHSIVAMASLAAGVAMMWMTANPFDAVPHLATTFLTAIKSVMYVALYVYWSRDWQAVLWGPDAGRDDGRDIMMLHLSAGTGAIALIVAGVLRTSWTTSASRAASVKAGDLAETQSLATELP
mmetsp:Transcript_43961/g.113582  ORF Transcript_43961/g.113582 Transcript_43961/m.113582 type:complete len:252 (-) Transcript_43961:435-1190(-)